MSKVKVNVEVDIKSIIDGRRMSIREFSRTVDHSFEAIRRLYNGEMTRYPKALIEKVLEVYQIPLEELVKVTYTEVGDDDA